MVNNNIDYYYNSAPGPAGVGGWVGGWGGRKKIPAISVETRRGGRKGDPQGREKRRHSGASRHEVLALATTIVGAYALAIAKTKLRTSRETRAAPWQVVHKSLPFLDKRVMAPIVEEGRATHEEGATSTPKFVHFAATPEWGQSDPLDAALRAMHERANVPDEVAPWTPKVFTFKAAA